MTTGNLAPATNSGAGHVIPSSGATPVSFAVFSYRRAAVVVSEAGVPAVPGTAFRSYVEVSETNQAVGSIQSAIAIANPSSGAANVTLELTNLDGTSTGIASSRAIPGRGRVALFLSEFFPNVTLPNPFRGVLRITTSSSEIYTATIRTRYNENADFLVTTTPATNENAPTASELLFPQIADGGGYTTQFILFAGTIGQSANGTLFFFSPAGQSLNIPIQ